MAGAPAPLLSAPGSTPPVGGAAEWVEGRGGVRLRAALFPAAEARGSVLLSPGRTEPIEKYYEVVEELRARGLSVVVHDWRGHGLSDRLHRDRLRGHGDGWRPYLDDFGRVLKAYEDRAPRPWIGLGHSMGGALTALALAEGEGRFAAAVLTAPMLGIALGGRPPAAVRAIASAAAGLGGGGLYAAGAGDPLGGTFEANILTHDERRWRRTRTLLEARPELQLAGVTFGWLAFALSLSARLKGVRSLPCACAIVAAQDERLVDNRASRAFAERTGARYVEVEGAFHEILMETDDRRAVFWAEFDRVVGAL